MVKIKIVENLDELIKIFIIRGIVYMDEQSCPYDEEFDLNDYTSTQILGEVGKEPILSARVRYFGSVAKIERVAVRKEYRGKGYAQDLIRFIIKFCETKGYKTIYLHAQERLEKLYNQHGFIKKGELFSFSNYDYIEMVRYNLEDKKDSIILLENVMTINRPENSPFKEGPLERKGEKMEKKIDKEKDKEIEKKILVVIDIQKEYAAEGRAFYIENIEETLAKAKKVLEFAREKNWEIIHVKHEQDGEIFNKNSEFTDYIEGFHPLEGECEFIKNNYSCYTNKEFKELMKNNVEKDIYIMGYSSTMCILSTIIDGYHRKNRMIYIEDASDAKPEEGVTSKELHKYMKIALGKYCKLIDTESVICI